MGTGNNVRVTRLGRFVPGADPDAEKDSAMNNIAPRNPKMQWTLAAAGAVAHPVTQRSAERLKELALWRYLG